MESFAHLELKRLAVACLARLGCQAIATEVRCPISKYRIYVAGWLDHADGELLDAGMAIFVGLAVAIPLTPSPLAGVPDPAAADPADHLCPRRDGARPGWTAPRGVGRGVLVRRPCLGVCSV